MAQVYSSREFASTLQGIVQVMRDLRLAENDLRDSTDPGVRARLEEKIEDLNRKLVNNGGDLSYNLDTGSEVLNASLAKKWAEYAAPRHTLPISWPGWRSAPRPRYQGCS